MDKKVEDKKTSDGYKEGAIAGGLAGFVIAAYLKRNLLVGAIIGLMAGGYIGFLSQQGSDVPKVNFKKKI